MAKGRLVGAGGPNNTTNNIVEGGTDVVKGVGNPAEIRTTQVGKQGIEKGAVKIAKM